VNHAPKAVKLVIYRCASHVRVDIPTPTGVHVCNANRIV
jgi:hypothetical protein